MFLLIVSLLFYTVRDPAGVWGHYYITDRRVKVLSKCYKCTGMYFGWLLVPKQQHCNTIKKLINQSYIPCDKKSLYVLEYLLFTFGISDISMENETGCGVMSCRNKNPAQCFALLLVCTILTPPASWYVILRMCKMCCFIVTHSIYNHQK